MCVHRYGVFKLEFPLCSVICTCCTHYTNCLYHVLGPPTFVHRPSSVRVNVSDPAVFHCSGEGNPQPMLQWWTVRDGWPIALETTGRIIISDEYLTIVRTVRSDSGVYFCTLNSSVDVAMSNMVFLTVWGKSVKNCELHIIFLLSFLSCSPSFSG